MLSLESGDGIPVLVGQNEMCQKWQNLYSTIQYSTINGFTTLVSYDWHAILTGDRLIS